MSALKEKKSCLPWWFDGHNNQKRSSWLHSTLSELDEKTMAMLKLVEEDADSFAQRAEMYYKKRPQLLTMVEEFYRSHRSLAERYDMLKSESRTRLTTPLTSPRFTKCQSNKFVTPMEKSYDTYSDAYSQSGDSDIDDPEEDEETQVYRQTGEHQEEEHDFGESEIDDPDPEDDGPGLVMDMVKDNDEVQKLRDEIERLKEENRIQKEQLMEKDEEKRQVIRQLTLSMEILRENVVGKRGNDVSKNKNEPYKKWGPFEFNKGKGIFSVKLFGASQA
ncbi:hypothetical protein ACHQM5_026778 [Ranunculus cassubicifolius]